MKTEGLRLSYVFVWRNDSRSETHYYAPHSGHLSVSDFKKFYTDKFTWFENDLAKKNVYKKKK